MLRIDLQLFGFVYSGKPSDETHYIPSNLRISESAHLSFYQKQLLRYLHLKFEKEVIFLGQFSHFPTEISESGDKISNF